jgi:hypothetical protein
MSKIQQMVEFAKQLRQVNVASLSEQQRTEYTAMVSKLQEELTGLQKQGMAEGSGESVSFREMVDVVDQHYPKYYAELSGSDISDKQFERAIVNAYKAIIKKQGVAEDQLDEFGVGRGFPQTPKYKVGDTVNVRGYQGVGKIAFIKARNDVGVIFNEPEAGLKIRTAIDKLIPKQGVAEGVQDTMSLNDAAKVLRQYGATNLKTTSNELHFYKDGRPLSVDLIFNDDATRSVSLSKLNAATRKLKGQGIDEGAEDPGQLDLTTNPSKSQVWARYMAIYDYDGYAGEENSQEMSELEDYAEATWGSEIANQMRNAGYQSFFGRDDDKGPGAGGDRLGRRSQVNNPRLTKAGVMHKVDTRFKKDSIKGRLGTHGGSDLPEGYSVTRGIDTERYQERDGLEGPFSAKSGKVVYYDPREGKYYDPDTDMYIEYDEWQAMNEDWNDMMDYVKSKHSANGSQGIKRGRSYGSGEDTEDEDYFNDKEQQTRGPLVRPTSQNTGHRVWSGKTQPKIPFDESIDTQAYDRLKRVFDFSDYKG